MVSEDDTYSFSLSPPGSSYNYSPDLSVPTNKRRIDLLFNDQRKEKKETSVSHTRSSGISITPIRAATTVPVSTTIQLPQPESWNSRVSNPKDELESLFGGPDKQHQAFLNVRSAVQAHIERVFADASNEPPIKSMKSINIEKRGSHHLEIPPPPPPPPPGQVPVPTDTPMKFDKKEVTPNIKDIDSMRIPAEVTTKRYDVDYLGAIQLREAASSLEVLQEPLKDLYYKYRLSNMRKRRAFQGELHITKRGVKIRHSPREPQGYYELFSPFSSIAVWAAVKLVMRREIGEHGQMFFSYAFLPLICDPVSNEKYNLYHELNVSNPTIMEGEHPPMFACVMKKKAVPYLLECHAFVCKSSEDAIVIAANLYQALLEIMKTAHFSDTGSETVDEDVSLKNESMPVRPPRKRKLSHSETGSNSLQKEIRSTHDLEGYSGMSKQRNPHRLQRSSSDRHLFPSIEEQYMKSSISRSHSHGNLDRQVELSHHRMGKAKKGLNSVDDVLNQVVNPRGMSFSEMKPSQRELLLKLVLTLSRDELYQRSKSIMKKYKTHIKGHDSSSEESTITSVLKATKRSISRLGSRTTTTQNNKPSKPFGRKSLTDQYFLREVEQEKEIERSVAKKQTRMNQAKSYNTMNNRQTPRFQRHPNYLSQEDISCTECDYENMELKSYCTLPRCLKSGNKQNRSYREEQDNSSSETSDLPCGCCIENCMENDKCYCSLTRVKYRHHSFSSRDNLVNVSHRNSISPDRGRELKPSPGFPNQSRRNLPSNTIKISVDAASSKSSSSVFSSDSEGSESSRSSHSSNGSGYHSQDFPENVYSNIDSSSSTRTVTYDSYASEKNSEMGKSKSNHAKILLVSAVDPSGKVVYRGASQKQQKTESDTNSILSMKKTAEIAALFSEMKLNQTTDLVDGFDNHSNADNYSSCSSQRGSILLSNKIENSLGYLP